MALVVGNVIGVGIFALPASLAAFGGLALVGWLLTASGALVLALVFARLSRLVPKAGGPYAYTRAGFGDFTGFLIAWGYWIGLWSSVAALAVGTMNYVGAGARAAGMDAALAGAIAIGGLWLVTWFNLRGVEGAGRFQMITTVLKLIPLVAIGTIGLLAANWSYFAPIVPAAYPSAFSAVVAAAALTMYSFLGIELATIIADNVDQPTRTVPRATVLGTLVTAVVYIMSTIGVMGALPPSALATSAAPYADAAAALWGPWASTVVTIGVVIAGVGALNGFILLQGHVPMAAAQDRLFPARFARRSRTGVPAFGCVFSSLLATAVLLVYYGGLSSGATGPRRGLQHHHPAGHVHHAGAIRLLRDGGAARLLPGPPSVQRPAPARRGPDRGPGLRLRVPHHRGLGRPDRALRLRLLAARRPGLRLDAQGRGGRAGRDR